MTNSPAALIKWPVIFSLALALAGIGCTDNDAKEQAGQKNINELLESAQHKKIQLELDLQKNTAEIRALREDNHKLTQLLFETTQRQKISTDSNSGAQATQPNETELSEISNLKAQMETVLEQNAKRLALITEKYNEELKATREEDHKYQQLLIEVKSEADSRLLKP
jgi:membrane-bound lytic murein transglycosylase